MYNRNRSRDLRLTADQYRRHRYRVVCRITSVVLVVLGLAWWLWMMIRPAEAQGEFTQYVDRDPWRSAIVGGFHMLEASRSCDRCARPTGWRPPHYEEVRG